MTFRFLSTPRSNEFKIIQFGLSKAMSMRISLSVYLLKNKRNSGESSRKNTFLWFEKNCRKKFKRSHFEKLQVLIQ